MTQFVKYTDDYLKFEVLNKRFEIPRKHNVWNVPLKKIRHCFLKPTLFHQLLEDSFRTKLPRSTCSITVILRNHTLLYLKILQV